MLSNFEHCEGGITAVRDILSDAQKEKENIYGTASSASFGQIIKQLWGEKVRLVKRGPRNQRQNFYLNLTRRKLTDNDAVGQCVEPTSSISPTLEKSGWQLIDGQATSTSFIRFSSWSFKNQRGSMEIKIDKENEGKSWRYYIASRGCIIDMKEMIDEDILKNRSLVERVEVIAKILEASTYCKGVPVNDDEILDTVLPYESGIYKDEQSEEQRAFSTNCALLSSAGKQCCPQCTRIKLNSRQRNKRKIEFGGMVHPKTNKRYMTKDDVAKQHKLERQERMNAEKREKYWRNKFEDECLEMTKEDHADLSTMFQMQSANNIPEDMADLWEQQKSLLGCKSKNAYRWHPKLVHLCWLCQNFNTLNSIKSDFSQPQTISKYT